MFGLVALLVSVGVGTLTYLTTRHLLVGERETSSLRLAYGNAHSVQQGLSLKGNPENILSTVASGTAGSYSVLDAGGSWYAQVLSFGRSAVPLPLRTAVRSGAAATQTFTLDGAPYIAVGVALPSVKAGYYELFDVSDLAHTLGVLALALFGAGLVTTALGAVVGRWASGRSLRPLTGVSKAAVAIASGRLDTRLGGAPEDRDLAGLTSSFNRMVDQLEERIERERRFTSDVSHELRSPLTTLSASLDVLEGHAAELGASGRQALVLLSADLRRFQRMVGDLLEISRSDTAADVVLEEVDAGELVRRSVAAGSRPHDPPEVVVEPEVDVLRLPVDKRRFERIVGNLLDNAALYGGGATRVLVTSGPDRARPTVRVSVEDDGPGIAAGERVRVFERFYRGQAAGRRGAGTGTGLGLSLVAEHVRLLGGSVWADDAPGGGARFTVELPADGSADGEVEAKGGRRDPASPGGKERRPAGHRPSIRGDRTAGR